MLNNEESDSVNGKPLVTDQLNEYRKSYKQKFELSKESTSTNVTDESCDRTQEVLGTRLVHTNIKPLRNRLERIADYGKKTIQNKEPQRDTQPTATEVNGRWPSGTCAIVGDSILSNIDERKISSRRNIKVRSFPGASCEDMKHYLVPILEKTPRLYNPPRWNK